MNISRLLKTVAAFLATFTVLIPIRGGSATTPVSVGNNFFSPANVTINQNDSVLWTWSANNGGVPHSSTGDTGLWDSGIVGTGSTFSFQFASTGSFPYHCTVHSGQIGKVTVKTVATTPPSITITNPANNSIFIAPANLTLAATASATGGTVSKVQFFNGTASLGTISASPYQVSVTGLGAGSYSFSAVVTDSNGGKATNSISLVVNVLTPLILSGVQWLSPSTFQFTYSTDPGVSYAVDTTVDFSAWLARQTNMATGASATFTDTSVSTNQTFYRVRRLAAP